MTTAHRATWKAARGGLQEEGSFRLLAPSAAVSSKDAPTERSLKLRQPTDAPRDELRARLEGTDHPPAKRPRKSRFGPASTIHDQTALPAAPAIDDTPLLTEGDPIDPNVGRPNPDLTPAELSKHVLQKIASPQSDSEASDDDSDDDDEADLLAELENIRREREYDRAKKQAAQQERDDEEEIARAAGGNPLMGSLAHMNAEISETASIATGSMPAFAVRRRWNDDVIFRNEANSDRKNGQRFINDTIRNDYHVKFMKRHIR